MMIKNAEQGQTMLKELLNAVSVQDAHTWESVQVFPLAQGNGHEPDYTTIDDLLEAGKAEITELHDGGTVPTIKVLNKADIDALILDGTELRGAKQNRMVNVTIIVAAHSETEIPVSCVEQGRWSYRSKRFTSAKRTVASKLRGYKARKVAENLATRGVASADQGEVWNRVSSYLCEARIESPTMAMDDLFARRETDVEQVIQALGSIEAHGAVVAVNGEIVGLDLFDAPKTFKKVWPQLLRGHAMDALLDRRAQSARSISKREVEAWVGAAGSCIRLTQHHVPGIGAYFAAHAAELAGGVATRHDKPVHTALFCLAQGAI